ncbi:MAG: hypothetical protein ACK5HP_00745 [Bacilli bacterium]
MLEVLKITDEEYIQYFKGINNVEKITKEDISRFLKLPILKIVLLIKLSNVNKNYNLFKIHELINLENFNYLFLPLQDQVKIELLKDDYYLNLFLKTKKNKYNQTLFELSNLEIKQYIILQKKRIDSKEFEELVGKLNSNQTEEMFGKIDQTEIFKTKNEIKKYIQETFKIDESMVSSFLVKVEQKKRNPIKLLNIKSDIVFYMYNKFNVVLDIKEVNEKLIFENNIAINKEYISKINEKHLNMLIESLLKKDSKENKTIIFLTALYTYSIFGYSNALSLINDKFTQLNDITIKRASDSEFIDNRRQYRLENQNQFYSINMITKARKHIEINNYKYFYKLGDIKDLEIEEKLNNLKFKLDSSKNSNEVLEEISILLKNIIKKR